MSLGNWITVISGLITLIGVIVAILKARADSDKKLENRLTTLEVSQDAVKDTVKSESAKLQDSMLNSNLLMQQVQEGNERRFSTIEKELQELRGWVRRVTEHIFGMSDKSDHGQQDADETVVTTKKTITKRQGPPGE